MTSPPILPHAPRGYDVQDQNELRRMTVEAVQDVRALVELMLERLNETEPIGYISGFEPQLVNNNGSPTTNPANRVLISDGLVWVGLTRQTIPGIDTTATGGDTMNTFWNDEGTWVSEGQTATWPNDEFNNESKELKSVSSGKYYHAWFYVVPGSGLVYQYARVEWDEMALAVAEPRPVAAPPAVQENGLLIASVAFEGNSYNPNDGSVNLFAYGV